MFVRQTLQQPAVLVVAVVIDLIPMAPLGEMIVGLFVVELELELDPVIDY